MQEIAVTHRHQFETMPQHELDRFIAQGWLDRGFVSSIEAGMEKLRLERSRPPQKLIEVQAVEVPQDEPATEPAKKKDPGATD